MENPLIEMVDSSINGSKQLSYYTKGSVELATETALTVKRLEPRRHLTKTQTRTVIAMVGLPARGKSFVSRKMLFYLQWSGVNCKIFNVGKYRREAHASYLKEQEGRSKTDREKSGSCDANFFDSANKEAKAIREKAAELAMIDMLRWLDEDEFSEYDEDSERTIPDISRHSTISRISSTGSEKFSFRRNERLAIFDATNSTQARRQWILEECTSPVKRPGNPVGIVFLESICDDQELLEENYRYKISSSPDFAGMTPEEALNDLRNRVVKYEAQYETISDDSMSYIKIFNLSSKLMVNHIYGRMAKELVPALMAWHIGTRPVYLCRPGQTISGLFTDGEDYVNRSKIDLTDPNLMEVMVQSQKRSQRSMLRGDRLGPNGLKFKEDLLEFCSAESRIFATKRASVRDMAHTGTSISGLRKPQHLQLGSSITSAVDKTLSGICEVQEIDPADELDGIPESLSSHREPFPLRIYTSTMPRAWETVNWEDAEFRVNQMSSLNPLDKGDYSGMEDTEEIKKINPDWYDRFQSAPFSTRFPGGESYRDITSRLKSVLIDVEQQVIPVLIVSHVSVLQCLMAYFRNTEVENCMTIEVPMHTVIKFTPVRGGGWSESQHALYELSGEAAKSLRNVVSESEMSALTSSGSTNDGYKP